MGLSFLNVTKSSWLFVYFGFMLATGIDQYYVTFMQVNEMK